MKANTKSISFCVSIILILSVILSFPITTFAAETSVAPVPESSTEITLYAIDDWAKSFTTIPDSYPQSYQIDTSCLKEPTFTSLNTNSVAVSKSGLITPAAVYTYWYDHSSYSAPIEGKTPSRITAKYNYMGGDIKVSAKNRTYYIHVNISDYAAIYATNIDLYYMDQAFSKFISIPNSCPVSYKIPVSGMKDPQIDSLDPWSVTVEEGNVTLTRHTWYCYGNIGYPSPVSGKEPDSVYETVSSNGGFVTVSSGSKAELYHINAVDYADVYSENIMRDYLDKNTTPSMNTYEKIDVIARFVSERNYDYRYSNAAGLVIMGGGDCWASTDAIIKMANMLGLQSWSRYGAKDYGAGGGHQNAMIFDGTDYYEVEAGYSMEAPRYYSIIKRDTLFSYRYKCDGVEVYQYDNCKEALTDTLVIPQEINGLPVISIADNFGIDHCIQNSLRIENIIIPDTVTNIGKNAFIYCGGLKELTIPASVTSIGDKAFAYYPKPGNYADTDNAKFVVHGFKGTAAESYAKDNGMIFKVLNNLLGDVDGDGEVTIIDATCIQRKLASIQTAKFIEAAADADEDGSLSIIDATSIQRWLAQLSTNDNIGKPIS